MTRKQFGKIVNKRIGLIKKTLTNKQKEYATKDDVFHNFKAAACISRNTKEEALWGMLSKHLVSIADIVFNDINPDDTTIEEKIGDAINYLILLEGMLKCRAN